MGDFVTGDFVELSKRGISQRTCRKFNYQVGKNKSGKVVQIANFSDPSGELVAQKLRTKDKEFKVIGDIKAAPLFGMHLWNGGKKLVITEGEIDALSIAEVQDCKWPVTSVSNGAQGAKKSLSRCLEYLEAFEEIILFFDMDEPGLEATAECAALLGKRCLVATLNGYKDPNEALVAGDKAAITRAIWNAKPYRPQGIVNLKDIREEVSKELVAGLPWAWTGITAATYGRRYTELYALGAGTGVGKTDVFTQQIAYDAIELGMKVGVIYLEQPNGETGKRIAGKVSSQRFHVPDAGWTQEQLDEALDKLDDKVELFDHFGETEWEKIAETIRYMATALDIRLIYLDHLTAMADPANERGSLEDIMRQMAGLAQELDIIIHFISHLATPDGTPHEEGGRVSIRHFKGSRAIGFWSHFMFGLERDQQDENPETQSVTTFRILKDRYTGQGTGKIIYLKYDVDTGLLDEMDHDPFAEYDDEGDFEDGDEAKDDIPF